MTVDPERLVTLDAQAQEILRKNDRGGYTVPTAGLYPYQWNWDSAFAAWGFAQFDPDRAWTELETLVSGQWPNGMIPHILFHKPDPGYFPGPDVWGAAGPISSSGISQPPVAATVLRAIYAIDPARDRLRPLVRRLRDWHAWFMEWRLDRGAVCITHPWESGRDNCPDWDGAMAAIDPAGVGEYTRRDTGHVDPSMRPTKADYDRYVWLVQRGRRLGWDEAKMLQDPPFRVADPTMTFILLRACRDLHALAASLDEPTGDIDGWIATLEDGAATLWNDAIGSYDARDAVAGQFAGCVSNASFLCWYAGLHDDRMLAPYDRVCAAVTHPVPSHDPDSPKFERKRYWRGPVWGMFNALIGLGLEEAGHEDRARHLLAETEALIARHGFAEYFDAVDGSPAGGGSFTWTAAIWLAWIRRRDR